MTEDELVGWHHRLDGHEFEQTLGNGDGQGSLVLRSMGSKKVEHNRATEQHEEPTGERNSVSSDSAHSFATVLRLSSVSKAFFQAQAIIR